MSIYSNKFTSLEMTQFLGNLIPKPSRQIQVALPGSSSILNCTPAQFSEIFNVAYSPWQRFTSEAFFNEVIGNCPWILQTRWGEELRLLGLKYRAEIQEGRVANLSIQWINKKIGYGVFAQQLLPPSFYIGEYTGRVRRLSRLHPDHNGYCFHYPTRFFSWKYFVIDALHEGNELRFINHSRSPNLTPAWALDRGLLHLLLFTTRTVAKGEELTFDYGEDYWLRRKEM